MILRCFRFEHNNVYYLPLKYKASRYDANAGSSFEHRRRGAFTGVTIFQATATILVDCTGRTSFARASTPPVAAPSRSIDTMCHMNTNTAIKVAPNITMLPATFISVGAWTALKRQYRGVCMFHCKHNSLETSANAGNRRSARSDTRKKRQCWVLMLLFSQWRLSGMIGRRFGGVCIKHLRTLALNN